MKEKAIESVAAAQKKYPPPKDFKKRRTSRVSKHIVSITSAQQRTLKDSGQRGLKSSHGSKNGDYQPVWDRMLVPNPLVGLTPFIRGNLILPKKSDVTRICQRTQNAYSTAFPRQKRLKHKDKVVERTIRETVKKIKEIIPSTGHIRFRSKDIEPPMNWKIDLFGGAIPLHEFYKK